MKYPVLSYAVMYFCVISLVAIFVTISDKIKAKRGKWRIPEATEGGCLDISENTFLDAAGAAQLAAVSLLLQQPLLEDMAQAFCCTTYRCRYFRRGGCFAQHIRIIDEKTHFTTYCGTFLHR